LIEAFKRDGKMRLREGRRGDKCYIREGKRGGEMEKEREGLHE